MKTRRMTSLLFLQSLILAGGVLAQNTERMVRVPPADTRPTLELLKPNADTDEYKLRVRFCDPDFHIWLKFGDGALPADSADSWPIVYLGRASGCAWESAPFAWNPPHPGDIDSDSISVRAIVLTWELNLIEGRAYSLKELLEAGERASPGSTAGCGHFNKLDTPYDGPPMNAQLFVPAGAETIMPSHALLVEFEVPSNDYRAWHQETTRCGEVTEVTLVLKEPGPGEGMLDVVEHHRVWLDLGSDPGRAVHVWVARTRGHNDRELYFELAAELEIIDGDR